MWTKVLCNSSALVHLSIILVFGPKKKLPRSLSRSKNSHVNQEKNYLPLPLRKN
uniref:Uncharacterized protein n=1 Tax=Arundo donax TaxID=35708 RepID=A0A0A8YRC6_ARUDO